MPLIDKRERDLHAEFLAKLDELRENMQELIDQSIRIREESIRLHDVANQPQPNPTRTSRKK